MTTGIQFLNPDKKTKQKPQMPVINAGATLLLGVLLVLVLVVLALLTYSAARSDYQFSRQMADKTTDYYAACNQAEETLAQVDKALQQAQQKAQQPDYTDLDVTRQAGRVCWSVPVNENQILQVEVSEQTRQILTWQVLSVQNWESDDTVHTLIP